MNLPKNSENINIDSPISFRHRISTGPENSSIPRSRINSIDSIRVQRKSVSDPPFKIDDLNYNSDSESV
jgi:hypothetical protein